MSFQKMRQTKTLSKKRPSLLIMNKVNPATYTQQDEEDWISSNLKKRQCSTFIEEVDKKIIKLYEDQLKEVLEKLCRCGYLLSQHAEDVKHEYLNSNMRNHQTAWHYTAHTRRLPTDAFGEICFTGFDQKTGRYVCVDVETEMDAMWKLMSEHWGLHVPNLIISVTGGAKNFVMKPRLKEVFNRGLIKAAESTKAWITTGGMHAGVMKHVGEAVKDHTLAHGSQSQIVCIGIVPWGAVSDKHLLISDPYEPEAYDIPDEDLRYPGLWPAMYNYNALNRETKTSPLDQNHTHFIMVDNGTQKRFAVEIPFRAKLEAYISDKELDGNVKIPSVVVVLEGGPGTLETVKSAIQNKTPAVIVEGSGRAADILAYAYAHADKKKLDVIDKLGRESIGSEYSLDDDVTAQIRKKLRAEFGADKIDIRLKWIQECIDQLEYMTIFKLDSSGSKSTKDIDVAILNALLKVNKGNIVNQLRLALAWDRVDVASEHIFTDEQKINSRDLEDLMFTAIQDNKVDFIKLFLSNGVSLRSFLTKQRMVRLYDEAPKNSMLHVLLSRYRNSKSSETCDFQDIGDLIKELMGDFYKPLYERDKRYFPGADTEADDIMAGTMNSLYQTTQGRTRAYRKWENDTQVEYGVIKPRKCDFDEPSRDLFIWSVLMLRPEMSMLFWGHGKNGIAASLTAMNLLQTMVIKSQDSEIIKVMNQQKEHYREVSLDLLSACYVEDEQKARKLLVKVQPSFGTTTNLQLAVEADNKEFISHSACQSLLNNIWMGKMANENSIYRLFICTVMFPLIFALIKWRKTEVFDDENRSYSCMQKLRHFFTAPVTKFGINCAFYFAFLMLYSVVLLTSFNPMPKMDPWEVVLILWILMILFEEIRQISMTEHSSIRLRLGAYIQDYWNILDVLTIISFIIGFVLRLVPPGDCPRCFEAARIILALNLMMFTFRVLHIFSVFKHLGPKLVMIGSMMIDMIFFMIILMVFIAAYGIALQAILYPNAQLDQYLLKNIFFKAYWQIYGELFLEELEGDVADCSRDPLLYNNRTLGVPRCPENDWFGPFLLGAYILISNVMMLNLLIAMFSNTFAAIEEKSDLHWNFQRYSLVREFHSRPPLPPPLIFISHIYYLFRMCCRKCGRCRKKDTDFSGRTYTDNDHLVLWEDLNADNYLRSQVANEKLQIDYRVKDTNERVDLIGHQVEVILETHTAVQDKSTCSSCLNSSRQFNSVIKRQSSDQEDSLLTSDVPPQGALEDRLVRIEDALTWIVERMTQEEHGPAHFRHRREDKRKEDTERKKRKMLELITKQQESHFMSRTQVYPTSRGESVVYRFSVPDEYVSWQTYFPGYQPVEYTSPLVLAQPSWADVDLLQMDPRRRLDIPFNLMDDRNGIDRRSFVGRYRVNEGIPSNPKGRTGIIGRGLLGRWGPNHAGDPVVTRWKRDRSNPEKFVLDPLGKPVLEFVSIRRTDNHKWSIPGGFIDPGQSVHECLKAEFIEEAVGTIMDEPESRVREQRLLDQIYAKGVEVYRGYADDPRNTDNAWIETIAYNYHDEDGSILRHFKIRAGDSAEQVAWKTVSSKPSLYAGHLFILKKVAERLNASF